MISKKNTWTYAQLWNLFPIPARPCSKELAVIRRELRKKAKNSKVLILGSTIEYRTLCKRLGIKTVVADFSRKNFEQLTSYSNEDYYNEEFREIDWMKITDNNNFDFILGHRIFNVIRRNDIQKMFQIMHKALKPGGVFFCRGNIFDKEYAGKMVEFLDHWSFAKRKFPLFTYIEVALYMNSCDQQKYVKYSKCRKIVEAWRLAKKISQQDFDEIMPLISMGKKARFRTAECNEIKKAYQAVGFKAKWITTGDEFAEQMPIIRLEKPIFPSSSTHATNR